MSEIYKIITTEEGEQIILYRVKCRCGKDFLSLGDQDNTCFECDVFEEEYTQ